MSKPWGKLKKTFKTWAGLFKLGSSPPTLYTNTFGSAVDVESAASVPVPPSDTLVFVTADETAGAGSTHAESVTRAHVDDVQSLESPISDVSEAPGDTRDPSMGVDGCPVDYNHPTINKAEGLTNPPDSPETIINDTTRCIDISNPLLSHLISDHGDVAIVQEGVRTTLSEDSRGSLGTRLPVHVGSTTWEGGLRSEPASILTAVTPMESKPDAGQTATSLHPDEIQPSIPPSVDTAITVVPVITAIISANTDSPPTSCSPETAIFSFKDTDSDAISTPATSPLSTAISSGSRSLVEVLSSDDTMSITGSTKTFDVGGRDLLDASHTSPISHHEVHVEIHQDDAGSSLHALDTSAPPVAADEQVSTFHQPVGQDTDETGKHGVSGSKYPTSVVHTTSQETCTPQNVTLSTSPYSQGNPLTFNGNQISRHEPSHEAPQTSGQEHLNVPNGPIHPPQITTSQSERKQSSANSAHHPSVHDIQVTYTPVSQTATRLPVPSAHAIPIVRELTLSSTRKKVPDAVTDMLSARDALAPVSVPPADFVVEEMGWEVSQGLRVVEQRQRRVVGTVQRPVGPWDLEYPQSSLLAATGMADTIQPANHARLGPAVETSPFGVPRLGLQDAQLAGPSYQLKLPHNEPDTRRTPDLQAYPPSVLYPIPRSSSSTLGSPARIASTRHRLRLPDFNVYHPGGFRYVVLHPPRPEDPLAFHPPTFM
ncbi:hypothetical protein FRB99_005260 [Tulasnella sp. 403]|nr:hypothetical protein FRB99_005260 [Tulasnella sp. 403]